LAYRSYKGDGFLIDLFNGQKKHGGTYERNAKDFLIMVTPDYLGAIYKVGVSSNNKLILMCILNVQVGYK
jgi:hypothetical protein